MEALAYRTLISTDQNLANPLVDEIVRDNLYVYHVGQNHISPGQYYWAVSQIDIEGNNSPLSLACSFIAMEGELIQRLVFPPERIRLDMVNIEQPESRVRLVFNYAQLDTGEYTIHTINPGGLTAEMETFRIAFRKPLDINVSAGYRPVVPLYGHINELFGTGFSPLARMSA
ncbi:MAG: hypothetical protein LBF60_08495 [Treponema sp.]|jgi:hypothetical protein|nr:hypothetical protein [Treponema sp.]